MYNTPWIDPRSVDYTDSANPLAGRGWGPSPTRNPFMFDTLSDPIWQALRNAQNLEMRIIVVPDPIDQTIEPGQTYTLNAAIEPNTWMYGIDTWATPGDPVNDFYVQITDAITGASIFSQQVHGSNLQQSTGNTTSDNGVIAYLSAPLLFDPPSYPIITIVNLSADAVKCNVCLFCAVEIPY